MPCAPGEAYALRGCVETCWAPKSEGYLVTEAGVECLFSFILKQKVL